MTTAPFATRLLDWFDAAGRKHLPWQQNITSYRVWISEIMLQQTQVSTVIPYYERFMRRFADVQALAEAPIDEVLHLWTGLGYYARARNLHRTAKIVTQDHDGEFPLSLEAMQALPGIGRSTAAAILSIASSQREPILDGNVKRVMTRYFGIAGFPGEKRIETRLWEVADSCTPRERVAAYTQAIMDLGATLCTRARPACGRCPVHGDCVANRDNLQSTLPTRRPKRVRPQRESFVLVVVNTGGAVLLERRPPSGIWGGLWTFPQFDSEDACRHFSGAAAIDGDRLPTYHHGFTHFDLALHPVMIHSADLKQVADSDKYCWYDPDNPSRIGLAKPVGDIIQQIQQQIRRRVAQQVTPCPAP